MPLDSHCGPLLSLEREGKNKLLVGKTLSEPYSTGRKDFPQSSHSTLPAILRRRKEAMKYMYISQLRDRGLLRD